jgi:glycerophosphoryl diester phosphodiesterase
METGASVNNRPLVIAHRGFSARFTENTMPAINAALRLGVDYVEIDVHETSDGQLVVFHDYRLHRLCGVRGRLREKTLGELKKINSSIPTLAEVLDACRGKSRLLIEIKRADARKVAALIEQFQMERYTIVFSLSIPTLKTLAAANPRITRYGLIAHHLRSRLKKLDRSVTVAGLGLGRRLITSRRVVERIHRRGWSVFVWTVNRPAEMRRLARLGVDGLITNHPDRALAERQDR